MRLPLAVLLLLAACLPAFPDRDLADNPDTDWDGDGYSERDGDCDDEDAARSPDSLWYRDADEDGFGDEGAPERLCDPPAGLVGLGGDCDDAAADVHPGAPETCNEVDDDCDGRVDDYDEDLVDPRTWYLDADTDDWGDGAHVEISCVRPPSYVSKAGDCDDTDATVYPSAPEICDEQDNDCDARVDDEDTDVERAPTWYRDGDGDGYGNDVEASLTQCAEPEGYVTRAADCDDANFFVNPDAEEVCNGIDDDCSGVADDGISCLG